MPINPHLDTILVPGGGVEPPQCQTPRDFKSLASTISATQAHPIFNYLMFIVFFDERCQDYIGKKVVDNVHVYLHLINSQLYIPIKACMLFKYYDNHPDLIIGDSHG